MARVVVKGAKLVCDQGTAPASLQVMGRIKINGKAVATKMDASPNVNIPGFGMCRSLANPQVAAATAAALGVLTPQPCMPVTKIWTGGQRKVRLGMKACLTADCTCPCAYAGSIKIVSPGQMTVKI